MKSTSKALLTVLVLLLGAGPAAAAAHESPDLLFVVDGSKNLGRGTRDRYVRGLVSSLASLLSPAVGRVGVLTFGGRIETTAERASVFPMTAVPRPGPDQVRFFAELEKALDEKLAFSFSAADFNVPFVAPGGVLEQLREREEQGRSAPLVVLLVSDGDFQVVEMVPDPEGALQSTAFEGYATAAAERYGELNRQTVNRAAEDALRSDVLDILAGVRNLRLVPVAAGPGAGGVLPDLAAGWSHGVLSFTPEGFLPALLRLSRALGAEGRLGLPEDSETVTVPAGGSIERPLLLRQGLSRLVLAGCFSAGSVRWDFEPREGSCAVLTGLDYVPCLRLADPAPGRAVLRVRNEGSEPVQGLLLLYRSWSLGLELSVRGKERSFFSGEEMELGLRVCFGDPPATVTDPEVLRESVVVLDLRKDGVSAMEETRLSLAGLEEGVKAFALRLGEGALEGDFELQASLRAFRSGDSWKVATPVVRLPVTVRRSFPVLRVTFAKPDSFIGEKVRAVARLESGRLPARPVTLEVRGAEGQEITTTLYGGEKGELSGEILFPSAGTWKVEPQSAGRAKLEPGPGGIIEVRDRTVGLYEMKDEVFEPLETLSARVDLGAGPGAFQGLRVFLKGDLKESENGSLSLSWKPASRFQGWSQKMLVGGKEARSVDLEGTREMREVGLSLSPPSSFAPSSEEALQAGTVVVSGRLGDTEVSREYPLEIRVVPAPAPWYLHPLFLAGCGAFLLLAAFLVWLLTAPRFDYQNIVLEDDAETGHPPYFFVDNAVGLRKNKAPGTDEILHAVRFTVKGRGDRAVCYVRPLGDAEVKVNGRKISGTFALSDGNLIEIARPGSPALTYRYATDAVAPVDLEDDEFVIMEYDEEEEFVLSDDEDFPAGEGQEAAPAPTPDTVLDAAASSLAAGGGAPPAAEEASTEGSQAEAPAEGRFEGVDLVTSPTTIPERVAGEGGAQDADAAPLDDEATLLETPGPAPEAGPAEGAAGGQEAEEVPAVDESAFGDFFEDEETMHNVASLEERIDESKDKSSHADMFDEAVTIMGFDGETLSNIQKARKQRQEAEGDGEGEESAETEEEEKGDAS